MVGNLNGGPKGGEEFEWWDQVMVGNLSGRPRCGGEFEWGTKMWWEI